MYLHVYTCACTSTCTCSAVGTLLDLLDMYMYTVVQLERSIHQNVLLSMDILCALGARGRSLAGRPFYLCFLVCTRQKERSGDTCQHSVCSTGIEYSEIIFCIVVTQ